MLGSVTTLGGSTIWQGQEGCQWCRCGCNSDWGVSVVGPVGGVEADWWVSWVCWDELSVSAND